MSEVRSAYDQWSHTYDAMQNKTRDLELHAGQQVLSGIGCKHIAEMGCGTGKNTQWLAQQCEQLTATDFSAAMLEKAKEKITASHVQFVEADLLRPWHFLQSSPDLITFSLVLEHIEHIQVIFSECAKHLSPGGCLYVCELHPYKQYTGSKARFETNAGVNILPCFVHHVSDYLQAAAANRFSLERLDEWFDNDDNALPPRLISFLFRKKI